MHHVIAAGRRFVPLPVFLLWAFAARNAIAEPARPGAPELNIKATIDGRDELRVTHAGFEWKHHEWDFPSGITINGQEWDPRQQPTLKNDPARMIPAGAKFTHPELVLRRGRGKVTLRKESDEAFVVQFHDVDVGTDQYEVTIRFRDLAWLLDGTPKIPKADARQAYPGDIRVTATIDGSDELRIYRNRAEWKHLQHGAPTDVKINGVPWSPIEKPRLENSGETAFLPDWTMLAGASHWLLRGRGRVSFVVYPDHLLLQFVDIDIGTDVYDVIVHQGESFPDPGLAEEDRDRVATRVAQFERRPLPVDPQIPTRRESVASAVQWRRSRLAKAYEQHGRKDPKWDAPALAFLERTAHIPDEPLGSLVDEGDRLIDLACDDPLVCATHGEHLWRARQFQRAELFLLHAVLRFEESSYPPRCRRLAPALLARTYGELTNDRSDMSYALLQRALEETKATIAEPLKNGEPRALLIDLRQDLATQPRGALAELTPALLRMLGRDEKVDTWVEHLLLADYLHNQGWQARGTGYANTVSREGWRILHGCLEQARAHRVLAWKQHPEFPEAAVDMIMIARAFEPVADESPRFWLDEAVAAQIDAPRAHRQLLWALRPRWGGTHEAMFEFGLECLRTKRFDTAVPGYFRDAVLDIASEQAVFDPLLAKFIPKPDEVRELLREVAAQAPESERKFQLTYNLLTVRALGWQDEAARIYQELGRQLDPAAFTERKLYLPGVQYDLDHPAQPFDSAPAQAPAAQLFQAPAALYSLAVSPAGEHVAAGGPSRKSLITVWNAGTGKAETLTAAQELPMLMLEFSPDSEWLAGGQTAYAGGNIAAPVWTVVNVWKLADGTTREIIPPSRQLVWSLCWLPEGTHLAMALGDRAALWNIESGQIQAATPVPSAAAPRAVAISPKERLLAVGYADATIKLYQVPPAAELSAAQGPLTLQHVADLKEHIAPIEHLAFSPDGKALASGSWGDGSVWVWDVAQRKTKFRLPGWDLAFSADGRKLVTTRGAGATWRQAVVWETATGRALARCTAPDEQSLFGAAFTPDGKFLLCGASDLGIYAWSLEESD